MVFRKQLKLNDSQKEKVKELRRKKDLQKIAKADNEALLKEEKEMIPVKFTEEELEKLESKKCIICLEDFEPNLELLATPCCHFFHKNCLNEWLKEKDICPLCLLEFSPNAKKEEEGPHIWGGRLYFNDQSIGFSSFSLSF